MNIDQMLGEYSKMCDEYATARAHRTYLEEYKKSLLAILMKGAEVKGHKTVSAQEREAYSDDEYTSWLHNLKDAVESEERLRYHIKKTEMEIEVWRSREATNRFERKAYGA